MRHWRDICERAKVAGKVVTFSKVKREQEVFEEKMSERGYHEVRRGRENVSKDQREVQATKGRLERKRQGVAVKLIQRNQRAEGRAPHS